MIKLFTQERYDNAKSRDLLPLECEQCHKTFYITKHYISYEKKPFLGKTYNLNRFCGAKCLNDFHRPTILVNCRQCGIEFSKRQNQIVKTKNNFCCCSCAAIYNNAHKTKGTRISKMEIYLQKQLQTLFPAKDFFHFNRKDTINSELDVYIPSLKIAFELNGIFHYEPIYGENRLSSTQSNDNRKILACSEKGISLCVIDISSVKYFKPSKAEKFLKIIVDIINQTISQTNLSVTI